MGIRVSVDQHKCIAAGNCLYLAPTAFKWRDGRLLKAEIRDPDTVEEEVLYMAADSCPTQAIDIERDDEIWDGPVAR